MDLRELDSFQKKLDTHWYYVSKGRAIVQMLSGMPSERLMDVGAGCGIISRILLDEGLSKNAVCVDPAYQEETRETVGEATLDFVRAYDGQKPYDLVTMVDVLEHVDDDAGLVREYAKQLPAGGHVLATVPAFSFLWSDHDVFLEHKRRYTLAQLEDTMRRAGLTVVDGRYFFGLLLPVAAAKRMVLDKLSGSKEPESDLAELPGWANRLMTAALDLERRSYFSFNRLGGLTAFCLARK